MYGPVFVAERWLVNAWPRIFTVYFFALANIPAIALAFVLAAAGARASRMAALVALAAWLCYRWLYVAFSIAANPEILELLILTVAWYAASRARPTAAWIAWVLATLTKVIPAIFAPLLLLRASPRAIVAAGVTGVAVIVAAGVGQRLSPRQLVLDLVVPSQTFRGFTIRQASHIEPLPSAETAKGLNSALARAANLTESDPAISRVQPVTNVITGLIYLWSVVVAIRLLRGRHALPEVARLTLSYGLFFALMPVLTLHTHWHTFVFLLPAWTAVIAALDHDLERRRATIFAVLFAIIYVFSGLPGLLVAIDRLFGTRVAPSRVVDDPIWPNLALIGALSAYAVLRMRDRSILRPPVTTLVT
jgi:hypothetical protein